jgi:alpha-tubulin suppressor-like RCC1 family protein
MLITTLSGCESSGIKPQTTISRGNADTITESNVKNNNLTPPIVEAVDTITFASPTPTSSTAPIPSLTPDPNATPAPTPTPAIPIPSTLTSSELQIDFGRVWRGVTTAEQTITLTYAGTMLASNIQTNFLGNATEFSISNSTCGTELDSGTCTLTLKFEPTIEIGEVTSSLRIQFQDGVEYQSFLIDVEGTADRFIQLDAENDTICGVTHIGDVYCWGNNYNGKIGDPGLFESQLNIPTKVQGIPLMQEIAVGKSHVCGITSADQDLWCWGFNNEGAVTAVRPTGVLDSFTPPTHVDNYDGYTLTHVSAGDGHTCVSTEDSGINCFGRNDYQQFGLGFSSTNTAENNSFLIAGKNFKRLVSYGIISFALSDDQDLNKVYCWGGGMGATCNQDLRVAPPPVSIFNSTSNEDVIVGYAQACIIMQGGLSVRCIGSGNLGDGNTYSSYFTSIVSVTNPIAGAVFESVSIGHYGICTQLKSGVNHPHYCWGNNTNGAMGSPVIQFGDNNFEDPTEVTDTTNNGLGVQSYASGDEFSCALHKEESLPKCWGKNVWGTLGNGTTNLNPTPQYIQTPAL